MFKWHVHSAIGRGRPATHDFARVAEGIAASLRQFSISASRYAQEDGNGDALRTKPSRSSDALREVSSLIPNPSRGIDARSLAAKPPQQLKITREMVDSPMPRGNRTGSSFVPRGDFRGPRPGGFSRGGGVRGGTRGGRGKRGAARGRGRGRGRKVNAKDKLQREKGEDDSEPVPLTPEELEYLDDRVGGFQAPYKPVTSAEDLARWGPPVISSPRGVVESLVYKMAVATDNVNPEFKSAANHHDKMMSGPGTLFENATERKRAKAVFKKADKLSQEDKEGMMKQWVAGQYVPPQSATEPGDVLAQVAAYTRRNETYLPADARKLEETLRALLPAKMLGPKPQAAKRPA
ncbi:hypothetical protein ONS95_012473 [Cadophora gregata]|uniref:uncharacterized protein n=1 Tax=Cadophora gregata TaxID=51156 RepID=UPI0026DCB3DF|nr:uncharacterized protein ONS95_012473 [Cadophora gregata]KAK0118168.1 hypothetical protein ONS95_012473 [Cadophora gregata]KAK0123240.1 hypothetical protein ONS96_010239 [Cadophora gregata f. sp. sojae]